MIRDRSACIQEAMQLYDKWNEITQAFLLSALRAEISGNVETFDAYRKRAYSAWGCCLQIEEALAELHHETRFDREACWIVDNLPRDFELPPLRLRLWAAAEAERNTPYRKMYFEARDTGLHRIECVCGRVSTCGDWQHHVGPENLRACECGAGKLKITCPPGCRG
jgi:hypothetical protein